MAGGPDRGPRRPGLAGRPAALLRDRSEVVAIAAMLLAVPLLRGTTPPETWVLGVVGASSLGINALALVLVYRSNRVINFAQFAVGGAAATFFVVMVRYRPLLRALGTVCPSCVELTGDGFIATTAGNRTWLAVNYWLSLGLALVLGAAVGWLVYTIVVKRFASAPKLTLTIATIFIAQLLGALTQRIPGWLVNEEAYRIRDGKYDLSGVGVPLSWSIEMPRVRFLAPDILIVLAGVIAAVALTVYLRRSTTGTAIRAGAENPSRLATLGVDVHRVTSRVWLIAGVLSAVVALVSAMSSGAGGSSLGAVPLVKMLTVAVIARMVSLPVTLAAALALGVLQAATQRAYGTTTALDGVLVVIIAAVLLLQRRRVSRAEVQLASGWSADREVRPVPTELRQHPTVRQWRRIGTLLLVVLVGGFPWAMSPSQTQQGSLTMIYAMVGLSLLILTGWAGQISLGQMGLGAVGGWVVASSGLTFVVALPLAAVAGALVAVVLGIPALKLRGLHLAIITLAFSVSAASLLVNERYLGRAIPRVIDRPTLLGMSLEDERVFYYFVATVLVLVAVAVAGLHRSRVARALIAGRDNEQAAQAFGIDLLRARLVAFAASGAIAALAGGLLVYHQHAAGPSEFRPELSVTLFISAVIGGFGSLAGPILGATYFGAVQFVAGNALIQFFGTGFVGLVLLLTAPGGFMQLYADARDAGLRRVAARNRIAVPSLTVDARSLGARLKRAAIAPRPRQGGLSAFVPVRYSLHDQWALGITDATVQFANDREAEVDPDDAQPDQVLVGTGDGAGG